jgi:hypothetical protein
VLNSFDNDTWVLQESQGKIVGILHDSNKILTFAPPGVAQRVTPRKAVRRSEIARILAPLLIHEFRPRFHPAQLEMKPPQGRWCRDFSAQYG